MVKTEAERYTVYGKLAADFEDLSCYYHIFFPAIYIVRSGNTGLQCRWILQNGEDIGIFRQQQVSIDYKID